MCNILCIYYIFFSKEYIYLNPRWTSQYRKLLLDDKKIKTLPCLTVTYVYLIMTNTMISNKHIILTLSTNTCYFLIPIIPYLSTHFWGCTFHPQFRCNPFIKSFPKSWFSRIYQATLMAAPSTSFLGKSYKYDVFLSFRGEDTRKKFVDHLYVAFERQGIHTYKDDERLEKGKRINEDLLKAIEECSVLLFSPRTMLLHLGAWMS